MRKLFFILFSAFFLSIFIFFVFQYFLSNSSKKGALQVTSSPESKVYLNDQLIGQTPLCKCETEDMQKEGEYTIRLVPIDKSLKEFQERINITKGVLTVVDRKFGKDSLSEGSVISLSPLEDKNKIELLVVSLPEKSKIFLDENHIGQTPLLFKNATESDHVLRVAKEGYAEKTVRIRTPLGYKLTVAAYLSTQSNLSKSSSQTASVSATPTPLASNRVTILQTPTGFLRVRATNSLNAAEVGRVNPGENYQLVREQTGWYEIKLTNGTNGFISSQYASKNN